MKLCLIDQFHQRMCGLRYMYDLSYKIIHVNLLTSNYDVIYFIRDFNEVGTKK